MLGHASILGVLGISYPDGVLNLVVRLDYPKGLPATTMVRLDYPKGLPATTKVRLDYPMGVPAALRRRLFPYL
jgi:hypothetical protein